MFNFDTEAVDRLCAAILSLETTEECKAFLEDLCTISEVQDMTQRLTAAKLLSEGKNYQQISEQLGVSTATISRVNRCLNYGAGGYETVLGRILTAEGEK
ncbi:MAG: helix-turn-helix domain-containing protein [Clostridia bacterium]|nr:helix-turn-helix domain-containing protein [Clostridia bacterium]